MSDGRRAQVGPGKLRSSVFGISSAGIAAVLASGAVAIASATASLSSGISLSATAGGSSLGSADFAPPVQVVGVRGRPTQIGPQKLRPTYGGVLPPGAVFTATATARTDTSAFLTTGASFVIGGRPLTGPGLSPPFNLGQFESNGSTQPPSAVMHATAFGKATSSADLSSGIPLGATASISSSVNDAISTDFRLASSAFAKGTVAADAASGVALLSSAAGSTRTSVVLSTAIPTAAAAFAKSLWNADVNGGAVLSAQAVGLSFATATASTGGNLNASALGVSVASPTLSTDFALRAVAGGVQNVGADLSIGSGFGASALGRSSALAGLGGGLALSAAAIGKVYVNASTTIGHRPRAVQVRAPRSRFRVK